METLLLNESFVRQLEDYITSQEFSIGTKIVYISNLKKIAKEYKELNDNNRIKIHKKLKHPYQRAIFKIVNDFCYLNKIPFVISLPSKRKQPRKLPEILTLNEIRLLIDSTPKGYKLFVRSIFGFGAGLRISEAIGIAWKNFNWNDWLNEEQDNMSEYNKRKNEKDYGDGIYMIKSTKRNKSYPVTVPKKLMVEYYNLAKELNILNEWGIPTLQTPVFDFGLNSFNPELREINPLLWKNRYTKQAYDWFRYHLIKKCFEPSLNKKIHIHMFRHSRASYLLEKGVPLEQIKELLGHEGIETTMIYTKVNLGKIRESMSKIDTI